MIRAKIKPAISLEELTFSMDKYIEITYATSVQFIQRIHKYMNMGWSMVTILSFPFFLLGLTTFYQINVGLEG